MGHQGETDWSTMNLSDAPEQLLNYLDVPASALTTSRREQLGLHLNIPRQDCSDLGYLKDWRGLAEKLKFNQLEIENFGLNPSPTTLVLGRWMASPRAKIGHLLEALCAIERIDILRDDNLMSLINRDIQAYATGEQRREANEQSANNPSDTSTGSDGEEAEEDPDILYETPGNPVHFDAFLSYASADIKFALKVMEVLEDQHGIKLCVPNRDLRGGGAHYTIITRVIKERCKKMIIVLSPEYIKSVDCDFHVKYQQALDPGARKKKLIPIMYQQCAVPDILTIIALLDYTKFEVIDWFWNRLAGSVRPNPRASASTANQRPNPSSRRGPGPQTAPVQSSPVARGNSGPSNHTAPCRIIGGAPPASEERKPVQTESDNTASGNIAKGNTTPDNAARSNSPTGNTVSGNARRANTRTEVTPVKNTPDLFSSFKDLFRKKPLPS